MDTNPTTPIVNTDPNQTPPAQPLATPANPVIVGNTPPKKKMSLSKKWIIIILVLLGLFAIAGAGGYFFLNQSKTPVAVIPTPTQALEQAACTLDAKECPDGSYVSRQGPKCEFAPCPTGIASTSVDTSSWKTFSNSEYSIKYPSNWIIEKMATDNLSKNDITFKSTDYKDDGGFPSIIKGFTVKANYNHGCVNEYLNSKNQTGIKSKKALDTSNKFYLIEWAYDTFGYILIPNKEIDFCMFISVPADKNTIEVPFTNPILLENQADFIKSANSFSKNN